VLEIVHTGSGNGSAVEHGYHVYVTADNRNVSSPQFLHMTKNKKEKFGFSALQPFNK